MSYPNVSAGQIAREGIYRILVCRPNHRLGNAILLTPLIGELERLFRGAEIDIVAEGNAAIDIFANHFSVNHVHCLPKRGFKHPIKLLSMLLHMRKTRYDLVIDPCLGSGFSRALVRLVNGRRKIGFGNMASARGLTDVVSASLAPRHMAKRPVSLLRTLFPLDENESTDVPSLDIRLSEMERAHGKAVVRDLLASSRQPSGSVVIGIFANATGAKRYGKDWWGEVIDALRALSPSSSFIEIIPMHGSSMLDSRWPGYYSTSIRRMGSVMAGVDLMISADCGVMHLAVASGVPTAGLFCVTDESVYAPYGSRNGSLLTHGLSALETARNIAAKFPELLAASDVGRTGDPSTPASIGPADALLQRQHV